MRRREFIAGLGGAVAWPFAAQAQQLTLPTIGLLGYWASPEQVEDGLPAFRQGLAAAGFAEGKNVTIEYCWGNFQFDRAQVASYESRQPYRRDLGYAIKGRNK